MLAPLQRWLRDVPADDPIDRRNAPVMQLLLLMVGTTLPISWGRHLAALRIPEGWLHVMAADMLVAAVALGGVVAIRRGHLQAAVRAFVLTLLLGLLVGYASLGFQKHMVDQTSQMLILVVTGLVIGRRALWLAFGALMAIFVLGFVIDARQATVGATGALPFHFLPSVTFAYFIITLVLDRCITALRASLAESEQRRMRLEHETAERERAQAQLIHAQKMDMAGRMASGVAHDFNNVLSIIVGLARERHRLDDPAQDPRADARALADALDCIERSALRGIELSRKLLGFSRNDPPRPQRCDLREVLASLHPLLKQLFPRGIGLTLRPGASPAPVRIDVSQLELALLNIAANARDAMPDGGDFEISLEVAADSVLMRLADTGCGMPEPVCRQAFEPFFSTKPAAIGTGLGLAMARSLVTAAQGQIRLHSRPGLGTEVTIALPLAPAS